MSQDPVLQLLYRLDKFMRSELTQTFTSKKLLNTAKDWSIVTKPYHQLLVEQKTNLTREEFEHLESTFAELERNLSAVADVFREIALMRGTPRFDKNRCLNQANAAMNQARRAFQTKLSEFKMLHRKLPDVGSKTLTDRMSDGLRNHPLIAPLVLTGLIIIGIGHVTDSMGKIKTFFWNPSEAHTPLPALLQSPSTSQHSEGTNSPNIVGDQNLVVINPTNGAKLDEIRDLLTQRGYPYDPQKLLQKYPLGYVIFEIDYKSEVIPYESLSLLKKYEIDWNTAAIIKNTKDRIELRLPDLKRKDGTAGITNVITGGWKKVGPLGCGGIGTDTDDLNICGEILAIRDNGIVFLASLIQFPRPRS